MMNFWVRTSRGLISDPYAQMPWDQKVSPHHRGRRKTHFLVRTTTRVSARTSMMIDLKLTFFLCILFCFLPCPPHPSPGNFLPQNPTRSPHRKKWKILPFFLAREKKVRNPVLPFLVFLEFLAFFPCEEFLVFSNVFPFLSRDFRGSVGTKNP